MDALPARPSGHRFVRRVYRLRMLGLAAGAVAIGAVLHADSAGMAAWALLLGTALVWPQIALLHAQRSADPVAAEHVNLTVDSALGGAWIAAMQFNLVPTAVLVAMLSIDKVSVGGWRLLGRTAAAQAVVCLLTWALLGFPFAPHTSMAEALATLPLLFVYPVAVGAVAYSLARKVVEQRRQLEAGSRRDALTGLLNHASVRRAVELELERHRRSGRPAALLVLDVDGFRRANDRHGHALGDELLRVVAATLQESVRAIDSAARVGGDAFALVLADTGADGAVAASVRIRRRLAAIHLAAAPELRPTLCIGIAEADARDTDGGHWFARADGALAAARAGGRDRIEVAPRAATAQADAGQQARG